MRAKGGARYGGWVGGHTEPPDQRIPWLLGKDGQKKLQSCSGPLIKLLCSSPFKCNFVSLFMSPVFPVHMDSTTSSVPACAYLTLRLYFQSESAFWSHQSVSCLFFVCIRFWGIPRFLPTPKLLQWQFCLGLNLVIHSASLCPGSVLQQAKTESIAHWEPMKMFLMANILSCELRNIH